MSMEIEWRKLRADELRRRAAEDAIVILPVGSIEQHGPHLPVEVDTMLGETVALEAARRVAAAGEPILVLPMLLSQLVIAHIFYDRHWNSITRNMAAAAVADIVLLNGTYENVLKREGHVAALAQTTELGSKLNVAVTFIADPNLQVRSGNSRREFPELFKELSPRLDRPFSITLFDAQNLVRVRTGLPGGALDLGIHRKLLRSSTTTIFILWMIGSSVLLTAIALLFLRNQVKPIVQLARAAERLGLGQEVGDFKPRGASEVRRAGRSFIIMAERIRRQVQSRTEMLAGISHDLRTPLTRMKLELEMASMDTQTRTALSEDIEDMRRMIDEYLDFARGDAGEVAEPVDVNVLLADIVQDYARTGDAVRYTPAAPLSLMLRPQAIRRALMNLIDNALRYGGGVAEVTLEQSATFARIKVTDRGPGIPEAEQESVFKPFTRLEPSRNAETGGVGLGLSIARTIAQSHAGDVTLENQRAKNGQITGLEVTLRLPRAMRPLT
jgi:two-component system osmolarity sensor histidine kinase EnvZ